MKPITITVCIAIIIFIGYKIATKTNLNFAMERGTILTEIDGVPIYFNGGIDQITGRNTSPSGYNIGLKWQCVEFVKRYYLQKYGHEMPDSYGDAKDFFDANIPNGEINPRRRLRQFRNINAQVPFKGDLIILKPTLLERYGHVAIVIEANAKTITYAGQNHGPFSGPIRTIKSTDRKILGWLRMP